MQDADYAFGRGRAESEAFNAISVHYPVHGLAFGRRTPCAPG